jgi:hypothetical protein
VAWAGAIGAAWAALIANAAALVGTGVVIDRAVCVRAGGAVVARVVLLTALVSAASWWIDAHGPLLLAELALLGMAYVALLPVAGLLGRADLEPFLPKWRRRTGRP